MTLWFLDASALLASEDPDDSNYRDARQLLRRADRLGTLDLAFYEVTNVAVRSWRDEPAARRLRERIAALALDGGLVRADMALMGETATVANEHGISAYDAAYVAAAHAWNGQLVSCDVSDLVSRGLACLPGDAL